MTSARIRRITQKLATRYLRMATEDIWTPEKKKAFWGVFIRNLRDRHKREFGPHTPIKAKFDPASMKAVISNVPGSPFTLYVDFLVGPENSAKPFQIRVKGLGQDGESMGMPWWKVFSTRNYLREFARLANDVLARILRKSSQQQPPSQQQQQQQQPQQLQQQPQLSRHELTKMLLSQVEEKMIAAGIDVRQEKASHQHWWKELYIRVPNLSPLGMWVYLTGDLSPHFELRRSFLRSLSFSSEEVVTYKSKEDTLTLENLPKVAQEFATVAKREIKKMVKAILGEKNRQQQFDNSREGMIKQIASTLKGMKLVPGGYARDVRVDQESSFVYFTIDPNERTRLDTYESDDFDEDDDDGGWNEDAWEEDYATPLTNWVTKKLKAEYPKLSFNVEVDDKGFATVSIRFADLPPAMS